MTGLLLLVLIQDLDVALTRESRRAASVLDEIADPAERQAFEALYQETDSLRRRTLASGFLQRYPASWLYAQAHEAAAQACFDLGDIPSGLFHARQSLAVYPENAGLVATIAAVQANRGERAAAKASAQRVLELLDRFPHPAALGDRLRATASKILGTPVPPAAVKRRREPRSAYAGSAACRGCHTAEFNAWKQTGMARMLAPVEGDQVIGNFTGEYRDAGGLWARFTRNANGFFFDLKRAGESWDRFRVDYTIGSKWQQAYATRAPDGDLHVLPIQYNRLEKAWVNYWRTIDPPGSERADPGSFHRLREVTSYQRNCAPCHTSVVDERGFAEAGINCEACHGPSAAHAKGAPAKGSFAKMNHRESVEVCAQCHAQSAMREPMAFPPRYQRRPYAEFSRKAFYKDGRFRETTFIVEAFERSACYREGEAQCGSCHDPHPANAAANPKSLKFAENDDRMCLQCHAPAFAEVKHVRHEASSEGARCVACHMPKIMNSLMFPARTHQIDDRPNVAMTERFGPRESPNACLGCHAERDVQWLRAQNR